MHTRLWISGGSVLVLAAALAACSGSTGGPLTDYAEDSDGGGGATGGDGGATLGDDAGTGAGDDAGGSGDDAGATGDGGGKHGDGGGGGIGTGGASKCAGSALRLCDGFEGAAIDTAIWSNTLTTNATVTLDATHVARGSKALHVHTGVSGADTAGTNGGVRTSHGFPFPNDDLWGRVFVYMAHASPDEHTNMVEAVGNLADGTQSHYRLGVTTNHVLSGNYIPGDYADRSATVMPLDSWHCFEWHYDGKQSEYHVYLDGNELTDMAITSGHTPAWTAPQFAYVEMGLHLYHDLPNEPVLDAWFDEVALDGARVGCTM